MNCEMKENELIGLIVNVHSLLYIHDTWIQTNKIVNKNKYYSSYIMFYLEILFFQKKVFICDKLLAII